MLHMCCGCPPPPWSMSSWLFIIMWWWWPWSSCEWSMFSSVLGGWCWLCLVVGRRVSPGEVKTRRCQSGREGPMIDGWDDRVSGWEFAKMGLTSENEKRLICGDSLGCGLVWISTKVTTRDLYSAGKAIEFHTVRGDVQSSECWAVTLGGVSACISSHSYQPCRTMPGLV